MWSPTYVNFSNSGCSTCSNQLTHQILNCWFLSVLKLPVTSRGHLLLCACKLMVFVMVFALNWGSKDGAVVRALASLQCDLGSILELDTICGLSLLLVLFSAPRGFSPGTSLFPSPQKPTFPNSNSIQISVDE